MAPIVVRPRVAVLTRSKHYVYRPSPVPTRSRVVGVGPGALENKTRLESLSSSPSDGGVGRGSLERLTPSPVVPGASSSLCKDRRLSLPTPVTLLILLQPTVSRVRTTLGSQ